MIFYDSVEKAMFPLIWQTGVVTVLMIYSSCWTSGSVIRDSFMRYWWHILCSGIFNVIILVIGTVCLDVIEHAVELF